MFVKKDHRITLFATVILLCFALISLGSCKISSPQEHSEKTSIAMEEDSIKSEFIFDDAIKTPHLVSNIPADKSISPGAPVNVIINFNFNLYEGSKIIIEKDGKQYNAGDATIDENKLTLRVGMDPESPDGAYKVKYTACWPDGSCHEGSFEFGIDSSLSGEFTDLRSSKEITIIMKDIAFDMPRIIISSGTTVTWINQDDVGHTINSNPHPGHNYYPEQNSGLLANGEAFSLTFDKPGFYPYHCSPHYSTMEGAILVE